MNEEFATAQVAAELTTRLNRAPAEVSAAVVTTWLRTWIERWPDDSLRAQVVAICRLNAEPVLSTPSAKPCPCGMPECAGQPVDRPSACCHAVHGGRHGEVPCKHSQSCSCWGR